MKNLIVAVFLAFCVGCSAEVMSAPDAAVPMGDGGNLEADTQEVFENLQGICLQENITRENHCPDGLTLPDVGIWAGAFGGNFCNDPRTIENRQLEASRMVYVCDTEIQDAADCIDANQDVCDWNVCRDEFTAWFECRQAFLMTL